MILIRGDWVSVMNCVYLVLLFILTILTRCDSSSNICQYYGRLGKYVFTVISTVIDVCFGHSDR